MTTKDDRSPAPAAAPARRYGQLPERRAKTLPGAPIPPAKVQASPAPAAAPAPAPAPAARVEAVAARPADPPAPVSPETRRPCACNAPGCVECFDRTHPVEDEAREQVDRQSAQEPAQRPAAAPVAPAVADASAGAVEPVAPPAGAPAGAPAAPIVLAPPAGIIETTGDAADRAVDANRKTARKATREKAGAANASGPSGKGSGSSPGQSSSSPAAAGGSPPREDASGAGGGQEPPAAGESFACTDLGNAERLRHHHGANLRFVGAWGWLTWDGRRWVRDDINAVQHLASMTAKAIGAEAATAADEAEARKILKHAYNSQSSRSINGMVQLARSIPSIAARVEAFDDSDLERRWLFNCRNGVVDLRTGELLPHRRELMLMKSSPIAYDPAARSETWEKFLRDNLDGDTERGAAVVEYLRCAAGYSLTGDTSEEALFFLYGAGGSGKSTFLEAMRAMLGDYAMTARFDMFLQRKGDAPSANPEEARLRGARFVASVETDDGKRLSEGTIKRLTGADTINARELYSNGFDFKPTFKLWLAANDAPKVNDRDGAMFRRVHRITFPHGREENNGKRDPRIKAELVNAEVSGAAILAWAVAGCLAWQKAGRLVEPAAVIESTNAYRAENDPLAEFFKTRVVFGANAKVARKTLRDAYVAWCGNCGSGVPMTPVRFAERLKERLAREHGAEHKPETSVWLNKTAVDGWRGLTLPELLPAKPREDGERERFDA